MTAGLAALVVLALAGPARAEAPEPAPAAEPAPRARRPYQWGGIVLPTLNYNSTDGFGLGVGTVLYNRLRAEEHGYKYRFILSTFWTVTGNYGSNYFEIEHAGRHRWMLRVTYRLWNNLVYVGQGGEDVIAVDDPEASLGNRIEGPSLLGWVTHTIPGSPVSLWAQVYARYVGVRPDPGGLLDAERPYGVDGGLYFDTSVGVYIQETDRFPLPHKGVIHETSVRVGGSAVGEGLQPLWGVYSELIGWVPVVGQWLVLGARTTFDKSWGPRPFWEQENAAGLRRDEVAYEQMLTGYGRSRTRGDGFWATMVEVRPYFGKTRHPTFDIGFYASLYAETAFLFDGNRLGPHLPTIGIAPELVWQGATQLRPFLAWGWRRDAPGERRYPSPQVGLSLLGPL